MELVQSEDITEEPWASWESDRPQKLFNEGRIEQAAELGLPVAMGEMAERHMEAEEYAKAFDQATKAANSGDPKGALSPTIVWNGKTSTSGMEKLLPFVPLPP